MHTLDSVPDLEATLHDMTEQRQAEERLHFLAEASTLLASSLDYEATLADLAKLLVPRLADY